MKYLLITMLLLFLFVDMSAQNKIFKDEISRVDGDNNKMTVGLFTRARNIDPFREDTMYILVKAEAASSFISGDALNLYVNRAINDKLRIVVDKYKKSLIFYQYMILDESKATHMLNVKVEPKGMKMVIKAKDGEEITVIEAMENSWYFRME